MEFDFEEVKEDPKLVETPEPKEGFGKRLRNSLYRRALLKWGGQKQALVAATQLGKLTNNLVTFSLGRASSQSSDQIIEDLVDAKICLDQMVLLHGGETETFKAKLLERLARLETLVNL